MFRNVLLILGVLCIFAGLGLGYVWLTNQDAPPPVEAPRPEARPPEPPPAKIAVMSVSHDIASGTLLQQGDIQWKDIAPTELRPGNIARGQALEAEFVGALAKRDFASGEALASGDLVKHSDKRFLAAALKPGGRAISIPVDAQQSAYGLIEPGNYVDVILTQNLTDQPGDSRLKVVAETILQNVRVIAVDQTLTQQARAGLGAQIGAQLAIEPRLPKTVTLELTKRQAETVFVALQLGKLQLSVRSLEETSSNAQEQPPTWAGDVSTALRQLPRTPAPPSTGSLESSIRRPPAVIR